MLQHPSHTSITRTCSKVRPMIWTTHLETIKTRRSSTKMVRKKPNRRLNLPHMRDRPRAISNSVCQLRAKMTTLSRMPKEPDRTWLINRVCPKDWLRRTPSLICSNPMLIKVSVVLQMLLLQTEYSLKLLEQLSQVARNPRAWSPRILAKVMSVV